MKGEIRVGESFERLFLSPMPNNPELPAFEKVGRPEILQDLVRTTAVNKAAGGD